MDYEYYPVMLGVEHIKITNPSLDEEYIARLTEALKSGEITPHQLSKPWVRVEKGQGYYAADGNHHLTAYQRVGIKQVIVDVYSLGEPIDDDLSF